jgi:hypothetical protein
VLVPAPAEEPGIPCQFPELGHLCLLAVESAPPNHHLRLLDNPARNTPRHIRRHKMDRKRDPETCVPGTPALLIRTLQTGVPHRIPVPAPSRNPVENDRRRHRSVFAWSSATLCLALPAPPFLGEILRPSAPSASRASRAQSPRAELASPLSVHHHQHGNPRTCLRAPVPARLPKEKVQNLQQRSGGP